jgi:hypothetical protein
MRALRGKNRAMCSPLVGAWMSRSHIGWSYPLELKVRGLTSSPGAFPFIT